MRASVPVAPASDFSGLPERTNGTNVIIGLLILLTLATTLVVGGYLAIVYRNIRHPARQTAGWALAHQWPPAPDEIKLPYTEWILDASDGVRLPVWDIPSEQASADTNGEPVLVVLHGWHWRTWSLVALPPASAAPLHWPPSGPSGRA